MCVGKALTGGYLTMGVTLATDEVAEGVSGGVGATSPVPLMHGPTFMANPLACAVANASLELLLASPWEARVAAIEARLEAALRPLAASAVVSDVRVRERGQQRANVPWLAAPCSRPLLQKPTTPLAQGGCSLGPRGELSPLGCRSEAAAALCCLPRRPPPFDHPGARWDRRARDGSAARHGARDEAARRARRVAPPVWQAALRDAAVCHLGARARRSHRRNGCRGRRRGTRGTVTRLACKSQ